MVDNSSSVRDSGLILEVQMKVMMLIQHAESDDVNSICKKKRKQILYET